MKKILFISIIFSFICILDVKAANFTEFCGKYPVPENISKLVQDKMNMFIHEDKYKDISGYYYCLRDNAITQTDSSGDIVRICLVKNAPKTTSTRLDSLNLNIETCVQTFRFSFGGTISDPQNLLNNELLFYSTSSTPVISTYDMSKNIYYISKNTSDSLSFSELIPYFQVIVIGIFLIFFLIFVLKILGW